MFMSQEIVYCTGFYGKFCKTCDKLLPSESFAKCKNVVSGLRSSCKKCLIIFEKNRRDHPDTRQACIKVETESRLKREYGISISERDDMVNSQDRKCKICFLERKLYVDHCHSTGKVRGMLCGTCNSGIGFFKDSPDMLESAIRYLRSV